MLFGDRYYYQGRSLLLPGVEENYYGALNSELFVEICDGQILELSQNFREQNDVDFYELIADWRIITNGGKLDFKTYGTIEYRKLLCWTNDPIISRN